jgi:hypothetical protein
MAIPFSFTTSYNEGDGCDLTIDVELNGPSRIVLECGEYEIEIQSGGDAPASLGSNRGASAGLGGQAPQGMQGVG